MFILLIILVLIQALVIADIPRRQREAERLTSETVLSSFGFIRSTLAGSVMAGGSFSASIPLGTLAVSPFGAPSDGTMSFGGPDVTSLMVSLRFVPQALQASVQKIDQDVILVMDQSGSMTWNDPTRLRVTGAKEYVGRLAHPDRVAVVAFNSEAYLVPANMGRPAHGLGSPGHDGIPDYSDPQSDLDTIGASGGTNIGAALQVANDELIANGDPDHAWVEILLTDGQNNFPWQNSLTISEAQRAKANGITIYTIGLSSQADAVLLTQVASITGGTYYNAPTPASIRWIYYEIAMHYQSSVQCGTLYTAEATGGALSVDLRSREYPAQTVRLESGAISVRQRDGTAMRSGLPLTYTPTVGGGDLALSLITLVGPPVNVTGTGYAFLQFTVLGQTRDEQPLTKVSLSAEALSIGSISDFVQFWAGQGAATQSAAAAIRSPLDAAQGNVERAAANESSGNPVGARFDLARAQAQLSSAIQVTETQRAANQIQNWLAKSVEDRIVWQSCRLNQWENWYDGVTLAVTSPEASSWAAWLDKALTDLGAPHSSGSSGDSAVVSIHRIDRIVTDRRVVQVTGS